MTDPAPRLEWPAIWRAALSVATFAVPIGLAQQWLVGSGRISADGAVNLVLFFAVLCCGAIGGFGAAQLCRARPLHNGAAAAALAYLAIQAGGALRRLIVGEPLANPLGWIFLALLMATCGTAGAALEGRTRAARRER